jgi:glycosyltransferase involved in cell wall biosynthesis
MTRAPEQRPAPDFTVAVAALTGIHALDLGRQLSTRGQLAAYYTALPASRTPGIDPAIVHRHRALLLPIYALMKGWPLISPHRLARIIDCEFDRWASGRVVRSDVVHAIAGLGRRFRLMAQKRFGAMTVCDSGNTHIREHQALQDAEAAKWGRPPIQWDEGEFTSIEQEYEESDLILVPSTFAYRSFVARGVAASKLALVPYGVDAEEYRALPKKNDGRFRILFVGGLTLRKGLPYLLDAVAGLEWGNAELLLRGTPSADSQTLLASYRGTIPITLVPPQPRAMLSQLYSNASVLVLPSIEDGFGLVIGQALACGTPVIASTHTGGPDVIEEGINGLIVPAGDAERLKEALTRLHENPEMVAEMGRRARLRVERSRGWGEYGDGVVAAFRQALASRGVRPEASSGPGERSR